MTVSLILASFAGVLAVTAYTLLARRFGRLHRWWWLAYFAVLLVTESFFTIVYFVGIVWPGTLPDLAVTVFLLYAIPVSVGMSALGWLVFHFRLAEDDI